MVLRLISCRWCVERGVSTAGAPIRGPHVRSFDEYESDSDAAEDTSSHWAEEEKEGVLPPARLEAAFFWSQQIKPLQEHVLESWHGDDCPEPMGSFADSEGALEEAAEASEGAEDGALVRQARAGEEVGKPWGPQFDAFIDRGAGKRMGLYVQEGGISVRTPVKVMSVVARNSAIADWNLEHPAYAVKEGDYILSVNSQTDIRGMLAECSRKQMLHVTLKRAVAASAEE